MLKQQVTEGSHGEYTLSIDDLSISLLSRSIIVENVIIAPSDQKAAVDKAEYVIKADRLKILDISLLPYFRDKDLIIGRIEFEDPRISIYQGNERLPVKDNAHIKEFSLYNAIKKKLHSVTVSHIDIMNCKFNVYRGTTDTLALLSANENSISLTNFRINETTDAMHRLFAADKFEIVMNNFGFHLKEGLYTLFGKKLYASYTDSIIKVDSFQLVPNYSKEDFGKKADRQISRVSLVSSKIELSGVNVKLFLELNWLIANKLELTGFNIDVYRDNNIPLKPIIRPSLQAILRDIPFYISVDTVRLKDASVISEIIAEGTNEPGIVKLTHLKGLITGVNNDSSSYTSKSVVSADIRAMLMDETTFHAKFIFPLITRKENFICSGSLGKMPIKDINPVLENTKSIKVLSGQIDSMNFHFTGGEKYSEGKMTFAYHDLTVEVLDKDEKKTLKDKMKDLVANKVVLRKSNPGVDGRLRTVDINAERNPYRYFPYFSSQSLVNGIVASIEGEQKSKFLKRTRLLQKK